jgi:hypothetical protein
MGLALALSLGGVAGTLAVDAEFDVCLEFRRDRADPATWTALVESMRAVVRDRTALFPAASLVEAEGLAQDGRTPVWRLLIDAGHATPGGATAPADSIAAGVGSCLPAGRAWGASLGRTFLDAGADQLLAEAPTTPGIDSSVDIEWLQDEDRLRTVLAFAGPLDIPNGTCWLDERIVVDAGRARVETEQGVETSPFAEGACRRFFDFLPDGGAGGQAVTLLPTEVTPPGRPTQRLVTTAAGVSAAGVTLGGEVESG